MLTGPSWLVNGHIIATKIKSSARAGGNQSVEWKSNPCRACPNCQYIIDNSDEWPGLPRGVKFDPTDQEIIWHLLAKCGTENLKPHPFIDEFIPSVNKNDGICYAHPQNLPGVKQDGNVAHFFHRAVKAYNTGSRKRRKIHGNSSSDVRWHKTGRTKPVILNGVQKGCKKIMVLYVCPEKGGKAEKTNWVMHQYHLGTHEEENDGEYVISKIFYQLQIGKANDVAEHELSEINAQMVTKVDPVIPNLAIPTPPRTVRQISNSELESALTQTESLHHQHFDTDFTGDLQKENACKDIVNQQHLIPEDNLRDTEKSIDNPLTDDPTWWENESLILLNSQQLVEGLSLCDDLLQSQSPNRLELSNYKESKGRPRLADYRQLGSEYLKKDLEECQNIEFDPDNLELGTPPDLGLSQDFRLSQLEFCSQDSFCAWGGDKVINNK